MLHQKVWKRKLQCDCVIIYPVPHCFYICDNFAWRYPILWNVGKTYPREFCTEILTYNQPPLVSYVRTIPCETCKDFYSIPWYTYYRWSLCNIECSSHIRQVSNNINSNTWKLTVLVKVLKVSTSALTQACDIRTAGQLHRRWHSAAAQTTQQLAISSKQQRQEGIVMQ